MVIGEVSRLSYSPTGAGFPARPTNIAKGSLADNR